MYCSAGEQEQGPECEPTTSRERHESRKGLTLPKCSSKEQKYQLFNAHVFANLVQI